MAYSTPTLSEFRAKYPTFAAVADDTVQAWLNDGDGETSAWPERDRAKAVMLYAAHRLSSAGLGTDAVPAGVTSFKSGTFSASLSENAASRTGWAATTYGREYQRLLRRNFGGPRLAWAPRCNA